jgi:hypothetical protein
MVSGPEVYALTKEFNRITEESVYWHDNTSATHDESKTHTSPHANKF